VRYIRENSEPALRSRRIDLGLVRPIETEKPIRSASVFCEGLALALPLDHPLAGPEL
jgi:hypothetical protein